MAGADKPVSRFVVTVDDPGGLIRDLEQFHRTEAFFEAEGAPVSFFVVPRAGDTWRLDESAEWLEALHDSEARGNDCQLHGLDHATCEFGPYPDFVRALGGSDAEGSLRAAQQQFGHLWRRDLFVEKLETALGIFEGAFGRRPQAFRGGALSESPELYQALAEVGMRYVSNKVVDPRGWKYIVGEYDDPGDWDPDVPPAPYKLTDSIVCLPMISEYAWRLTPDMIEPHLALAVDDLRRVYENCGVFVLICHVQEVGSDSPLARELLSRLLRAAREEYRVRFMTLRELIADVESGVVSVIAP